MAATGHLPGLSGRLPDHRDVPGRRQRIKPMRLAHLVRVTALGLLAWGCWSGAGAQDTVTIPRARLEELERKEKELERLKSELSVARDETARIRQEKQQVEARAAALTANLPEPSQAHTAPRVDTLPPLQKGDTVEAADLAAHFRDEPAAAAGRYRGKTFQVQGEIIGFDKPMFSRNYHVLLRGADRQTRVLAVVTPPDKYVATYTAKGGTELIGVLSGGARATLARVGQVIRLAGRCRGMEGQIIELTGCVWPSAL